MAGSSSDSPGDPRRSTRLAPLRLLDTTRDEVFDRLTRLAAHTLRVPVAFISMGDEQRQSIESAFGFGERAPSARETEMIHSICRLVHRHEASIVVADAGAPPLVRDAHALAETGIASFLALPLRRRDDGVSGTFAVADRMPREWTADDVSLLSDFADLAMSEAVNRAEAERVEGREARWRMLLEGVPVGIYLSDAAGGLTYVNPQVTRLVGRDELALLGAGWLSTVHPDDRDEVRARWSLAVERGRVFEHQYRVVLEDGAVRWVHEVAQMRRDLQGNLVGAVGALDDVTDRRALEERLRHAQKLEAVGRLAGGVAHDFNNLLTAILGSAELALDAHQAGDDAEAVRLDLEEIRTAAARGSSLTRQLLAFARQQTLQLELLDINAVVRDAERLLRRLVGGSIRIRLVLHHEALVARADRGQLEQVLIDLAVNARDAMPDGGTLTIETAREPDDRGGHARILVTDSGVGMEEGIRMRAFEPFFTTKPPGDGTGLGLATVHGIIEQLAGRIALHSTPGEGTTVEILLPRLDGVAPRAAESPVRRTSGRAPGSAGVVLLAEDEAPLRDVVRRVLERAGYEVLAAGDGVDALERLHAAGATVDVVLADLVMPRMGGAELARRLRQERPAVRVLFMSGYSPERRAGGDEVPAGAVVLSKPFTPAALLRALEADE